MTQTRQHPCIRIIVGNHRRRTSQTTPSLQAPLLFTSLADYKVDRLGTFYLMSISQKLHNRVSVAVQVMFD